MDKLPLTVDQALLRLHTERKKIGGNSFLLVRAGDVGFPVHRVYVDQLSLVLEIPERKGISDKRIKELAENAYIGGASCPDVSVKECIEFAIRTALEEDRK